MVSRENIPIESSAVEKHALIASTLAVQFWSTINGIQFSWQEVWVLVFGLYSQAVPVHEKILLTFTKGMNK